MLKTIFLNFLFLVFACSLFGQKKFEQSTFIGIDAGGSLCNVSFNPPINQKLLFTTSAGLIFRQVSEPHIGIQIELNYAGRGWIENRDTLGTYKRNLKVLDIPVTAAFIAGSKKLRFSFNLGPYVSFRLHDKEEISIIPYEPRYYRFLHGNKLYPDYSTYYYRGYYTKPFTNNFEFGFTGGLSIEVYTKIGAFGIRASYSHGLTNIFPLNTGNFYYGGSRTQTINAGLTYFVKI